MSEAMKNGQEQKGGVLIPQPEEVRQGMLYDPTQPKLVAWASWHIDSEEGFALLSRVKHGDKRQLADSIGETIQVENAYVQPVESVNEESGEVSVYPWICLVTPDGTVYSCGSHGVYGALVDLLRFRRQTPWVPPMNVKIIQRGLKNGRRMFTLQYIPVVAAQAEPKKGGGGGKK